MFARGRTGPWLFAFLAAASFGATAQVATADHYHTYNNIPHGLVHGQSTTDGSYFGRTMYFYLGLDYYCAVGDTRTSNWYFDAWVRNGDCSIWSRAAFRAYQDECAGITGHQGVNNTTGSIVLGYHQHYSHQPPQSTCRVYNA